MSDKFFLDTNIFVYSFDQLAGLKARKAAQLIREALTTHKGVISYQVVQEFFNVALRRFAQPMQPSDASQYLGAVFRPLLAVHSWYDSLIVSAAIQARCDLLYTEDLQHGQRFGALQVKNPFL
jgi:predicted nucleic acid-binding protein